MPSFFKNQKAYEKFLKGNDPEEIIQGIGNNELSARGLPSFRIPDEVFRWIFANPVIPLHIKALISRHLKGWPDNMVYLPIHPFFNLNCALEFKSPKGKARKDQKKLSGRIAVNFVRKEQDLKIILDEFEALAEKLKKALDS